MYGLACSERLSCGLTQSFIGVSGLDENIGQAMDIVEDLIFNALPDTAILAGLKSDILKDRSDSKLSQSACFRALQKYIFNGPEFIRKTTLTNEQVLSLTSEELLQAIRDLYGKQHDILYYGPADEQAAKKMIAGHHRISENPEPLVRTYPTARQVASSEVFLAPYDANQFYYLQYSDRGERFNVTNDPAIRMYNSYFGGGMGSIVFQEMRQEALHIQRQPTSEILATRTATTFSTPSSPPRTTRPRRLWRPSTTSSTTCRSRRRRSMSPRPPC